MGFTENPFTVILKLFKLSLLEYLDFVKTNTQNIPDYLRKLDTDFQKLDPTVLQALQNLNLIVAQKYKILLDIAEAINRK